MTKELNVSKSDSNNILKTIVIILVVVGIAYLVYYLYNQNQVQSKPMLKHENVENVERRMEMHMDHSNNGPVVNGMKISSGSTGSVSGLSNPIMLKQNYLDKGNVVGENNMEHFSQDPNYGEVRNESGFPKDQLTAEELLPQDNSSLWAQVNPAGEGSLKDKNFLQSGYHIGINTVGQTLRNANLQLRSEPPCPQVKVSPWAQSTIEPDVSRKPFEISGCA